MSLIRVDFPEPWPAEEQAPTAPDLEVRLEVEAVFNAIADDIVVIDQGRKILADDASNVSVDQIIQATLHGAI